MVLKDQDCWFPPPLHGSQW
uniref:Uncharacterized protein n=1 Tax=Anguilla anguilla TaxID=7936 RepID=A0A0E9VY46_ANGAN